MSHISLSTFQGFEEEEVPPLHLACTAVDTLDQFPVKGDMNFSKEFGIESEYLDILHQYLSGENVEGFTFNLIRIINKPISRSEHHSELPRVHVRDTQV